jgi:hypothetical protein
VRIGLCYLRLTYLGIAQPVDALGVICIVVGEDVAGEFLLLLDVEARSAQLDVVLHELVGRVVGNALGGGLQISCFDASLALHGVGEGHAGQGRWDEQGEETHCGYLCCWEKERIRSNDLGLFQRVTGREEAGGWSDSSMGIILLSMGRGRPTVQVATRPNLIISFGSLVP